MPSLIDAAMTVLRARGYVVEPVGDGYRVTDRGRSKRLSWIELVTMAGVGARMVGE